MYFQFKQFGVFHGASAMKVGTDGVTLGAWAPCSGSVLDVGCGCGLIGLMAAQRGASEVVLLDIDGAAFLEAKLNALRSPWSDKVSAIHADFLDYDPGRKFDNIISNPPFFATDLVAPLPRRALARHEGALTPDNFMRKAASLLAPGGSVSIIVPADRLLPWSFSASLFGLHGANVTSLFTKPGAPVRRNLVTFTTTPLDEITSNKLTLNSPQYQDLVKDFYL